ncbi:1-deoxy-D-xylulose-5-phosphate synthase [Kitasatospora sp. NPDC058046]|uniref:1-deoxy-D-xylulose-5-phosphate synthase n=1 Tax=Kitasatospora sp. NPDC058046 TaxID=3346312 RepID=UPI0036D79FAC
MPRRRKPSNKEKSAGPGLLEQVSCPADLRGLPASQLGDLAREVRGLLVKTVCATGGHLGPGLGIVELTIALHRVFDSPRDTLLFDIGHQGYVHKLLTGRQERFATLRQAGGLSGYLCRAESVHDVIENSHASTALSYADGLAKARALAGQTDRAVVAVIGDGAMTGGMAWEALDNIAAATNRPVIIVLNDNGRSYAPTTGALANHLARQCHGRPAPGSGPVPVRNLFTDLGLAYLGPIDGHDIPAVEQALHQARALAQPVVVHVLTVKGKGYPPAEADERDHFHAIGVIDPATGRPPADPGRSATTPAPRTWTDVFGAELLSLARQRPDLVAVTASMLRPTGLHAMAEALPDRVFDVGIAEQHAVASAAGLALGGYHPVVALYSAFLTRALDQVLMDVALHRLAVTFVLDRAGITGPDGPSHHGMWDISVLGTVPGLRIGAPRDAARLRELLREAVDVTGGPTCLRIPKATADQDIPSLARVDGMDVLHHTTRRGADVLLVVAGTTAAEALAAARVLERDEGLGTVVADPRWLIPVNPALPRLAARHRLVVTVEDNTRTAGFGTHLAQTCADQGLAVPVHNLGLPRAFLPHAARGALLADNGLDADGIAAAVLAARRRLHLAPGARGTGPKGAR